MRQVRRCDTRLVARRPDGRASRSCKIGTLNFVPGAGRAVGVHATTLENAMSRNKHPGTAPHAEPAYVIVDDFDELLEVDEDEYRADEFATTGVDAIARWAGEYEID